MIQKQDKGSKQRSENTKRPGFPQPVFILEHRERFTSGIDTVKFIHAKEKFPTVLKIVKKKETQDSIYYKQKFVLKYPVPTIRPHRFTLEDKIKIKSLRLWTVLHASKVMIYPLSVMR